MKDLTNFSNAQFGELQIFRYNGSPVTFQKGGRVMVNATEMAKPFGKQPAHWLRTQSTQEFINAFAGMRKSIPTELVQVVNGGTNYGTWMHEDVALEFAFFVKKLCLRLVNNKKREY